LDGGGDETRLLAHVGAVVGLAVKVAAEFDERLLVPEREAAPDLEAEGEPEGEEVPDEERDGEGEELPLARLEGLLFGYGALDVHGRPVVLFKGEWQLETCSKAYPNTRFVELGVAGPKLEQG
jgi:hypothetical protein